MAPDDTACRDEKSVGSKPSSGTPDIHRYERHWTPVRLDIRADDLKATLAKALEAHAARSGIGIVSYYL